MTRKFNIIVIGLRLLILTKKVIANPNKSSTILRMCNMLPITKNVITVD
jgi:hypothetical protein